MEVFLTSSSHLVCPVIKIDGSPVGNGKIGEVTERLKNRFHEIIKGKENKFQHWLYKI